MSASSISVQPAGTDPVATVSQNQGVGVVFVQQVAEVHASAACTPAQGSASTTSSTLVSATATARLALSVYNYGPGSLFIGLTSPAIGAQTASANTLWTVPANEDWTLPVPWTGALYVISDDAATYTVADFSP